uniref:NADH-ubiquinone oxidoreductase chain 4 n=1 Tax=Nicotiana tabacum TaxID=4097 RepID=A0A1S3ZDQ1_TOBAC|nr:PREDICTED: NADH-ubiquinone oxidoreductase chain 4-like [Nicotiana tabacum]
MSSHGLVSSALFLCVGVLYDRHKTRLVRYYGGSVSTMPNLSTIFFSSTLANMSSPGTSSFIGEFLILVGAFQRNSLVATLAALGMILGAAYSLWLYNRAVSGNLKPDFLHKFSDPNGREVSIFIPFLVGGATVLAMGRMRLPSVGLGGIARCGWGGLLGETDRKKGRGATMHGTSRPCLRGTVELATHECCRVGRANNSKAFEHEEIYHQYDDWNGNQKHDWGPRGPR